MLKNNKIKYVIFTLMLFFSSTLLVHAGDNEYIMCGDGSIPAPIAPITRIIVLMLQIIIPIVIIVMGSMDFLKAVVAADADKIKKTQGQFVNRLKAGAIFFFVVVVVKFAVSIVADNAEGNGISKCIDCLIKDQSSCGEITTNNPFIDIEP